ncbi:MAG: radical SAM protein [Anaerolineae bacterium]|nr:radical SAM protein [Anaerolineae bacterium]
MEISLVFGPVPSRRLGRSLGINHIPPKTCTYACVYCQLGRTSRLQIDRQAFYAPKAIVDAVMAKLEVLKQTGEGVDYLTLVPDGEPTLDAALGELLLRLKSPGIPLAVITNGSLLWRPEVREALLQADWVSVKVDAVDQAVWHRVDRPHGGLHMASVLDGVCAFAEVFAGKLVTETMLVAGVNDAEAVLIATGDFVGTLRPACAYLSIPTRPPAESWVHPPDEAALTRAYQIFVNRVPHVEYLIGYEGNAFVATGDAAADLLSITAVHPMREDAVQELLLRSGEEWAVVQDLIDAGLLVQTTYGGSRFYVRALHGCSSPE